MTTHFPSTRIVQGHEGEERLARIKEQIAQLYGQITSGQSEVRGGTDGTQEAVQATLAVEEPRQAGRVSTEVAQGEQGSEGEAPAGVEGQAVNFHHITGAPLCIAGSNIYQSHDVPTFARVCKRCGYELPRVNFEGRAK